MTVGELIEELTELDPDTEVFSEQPSHDYWRRTLGVPVDRAEETTIHWSEYHQEFETQRERDEEDADDDEKREVVLLRSACD